MFRIGTVRRKAGTGMPAGGKPVCQRKDDHKPFYFNILIHVMRRRYRRSGRLTAACRRAEIY
jgi:hypothetical protein